MKFWYSVPLGMLFACLCTASQAQILIGQSAGFSGLVAAGVKETTDGARLYLDVVNAKGGIGGQKIELISLDDKFDPKLAGENARILIEERGVVAMFLTRGTPHTEAMLPVLDKYGVPLIGPSTGAMVLHKPVKKHVFNVRATYQREAEKAVTHLTSIGITRIAVVYSDDSFGADGVTGIQKGLDTAKQKAVAMEKFDRSKPDFSTMAPRIAKTDAQAVMVIGSGTAVVDCIRAIKAVGSAPQFVTLSNNASSGFVKSLGDMARGVIVTQVLPQSYGFPLVKEVTDLARLQNKTDVSPAMLEGFAAAKVLVEALRRASPKISRDRIQTALEGLHRFDIGGMEVTYGLDDHTGLDFADLSIIGENGKFKR